MADRTLRVSDDGSLVIAPELAQSAGLHPGDEVALLAADDGLRIRRISTVKADAGTSESGRRILDWTEVEHGRKDRP